MCEYSTKRGDVLKFRRGGNSRPECQRRSFGEFTLGAEFAVSSGDSEGSEREGRVKKRARGSVLYLYIKRQICFQDPKMW